MTNIKQFFWLFVILLALTAAAPAQTLLPAAKFNALDRKSTRLNSSHLVISYAVFCLDRKSVV